MNDTKNTSGQYFKNLQIIYFAMLAGQFIFSVMAYAVTHLPDFATDGKALSDVFIFIVPVFVAGGFILSSFLYSRRLKALKNSKGLNIKLTEYRAALILRYATLEGPVLFALVVYLITADMIFLAMAALLILYFLTIRPTPEKAIRDIDADRNEEAILIDPNSEIL